MKILYVISRPLEINTSASIRNRATILGLLENGNEVNIFTTEADINHNAYDKSLIPKGAKVKYVRLGGSQNIARLGRKLAFLKKIRGVAYKWRSKHEIYDNLKGIIQHIDEISLKEENYDLIISSSDPKSSHLFVEKLLEKQNKYFRGKWIQIWGDPFLGDITNLNTKNVERIRAEEERLLSKADRIIYVSELTMNNQKNNYPDSSTKMRFVPIPYMNKIEYRLRNLSDVNPVEIVYMGDYNSFVRNILPLYSAVKKMPNIHMNICGGSDRPVSSCSNISVHGRVSYQKVKEFEEQADILIHLSNLSGSQIPGKIYQYSGTNKPILFIVDGEKELLKKQFEKYDRFCFAENTEIEIREKLNHIIKNKRSYSPVEEFDKSYIAKKIIEGIIEV